MLYFSLSFFVVVSLKTDKIGYSFTMPFGMAVLGSWMKT
jgi:hypothetical protein